LKSYKESDSPERAFHGWRGKGRFLDLPEKTHCGYHQGAGRLSHHDEQKGHREGPRRNLQQDP